MGLSPLKNEFFKLKLQEVGNKQQVIIHSLFKIGIIMN